MKSVLLGILLCLCSLSISGQYVIKGKVVGKDDNLPLPQVAVFITGTNKGVPTDMNGEFLLRASSDTITLTVKYIGYATQIITPDFNKPNLIVLKPECIKDFFYSPHLTLLGSFDFINNTSGGSAEMGLPYFIDYHILTTHSYYNLGQSEFIYRGNIHRGSFWKACDLNLNLQYEFQAIRINSQELNFNSSVIRSEWIKRGTKWIIGLGIGRDRFGEDSENLFGIQAGFEKGLSISRKTYFPLELTITRWNSFSQYQIATSWSKRPFEARLEYNHIKDFGQLNLSLGFYLRLRKLNKFERNRKAKNRQTRKEARIAKHG